MLAVVATLIWGVRERPRLLIAAWGTLLLASLAVYAVIPGIIGSPSRRDPAGERFERLAFGSEWSAQAPSGFTTAAGALNSLPVWDADRVTTVARRTPLWGSRAPAAGIALVPPKSEDARASWLVVAAPEGVALRGDGSVIPGGPDWTELHRGRHARGGRPLAASEADSGLAVSAVPTRDSGVWFGPGFHEFALAAPDTWPLLRASGVPIDGWWRRTALAWTLQSIELVRSETDGLALLWRRDVADRLGRLAPFAVFDHPTPMVADTALWWISYGYIASRFVPLARALRIPDGEDEVRYLRAGLVGAVNAATGDTRLYLAPGADSLAAAWGGLLAPLIQPVESIPPGLREQLPYPHEGFRIAAQQVARTQADSSAWRPRPRMPYEVVAPGESVGRRRCGWRRRSTAVRQHISPRCWPAR